MQILVMLVKFDPNNRWQPEDILNLPIFDIFKSHFRTTNASPDPIYLQVDQVAIDPKSGKELKYSDQSLRRKIVKMANTS